MYPLLDMVLINNSIRIFFVTQIMWSFVYKWLSNIYEIYGYLVTPAKWYVFFCLDALKKGLSFDRSTKISIQEKAFLNYALLQCPANELCLLYPHSKKWKWRSYFMMNSTSLFLGTPMWGVHKARKCGE